MRQCQIKHAENLESKREKKHFYAVSLYAFNVALFPFFFPPFLNMCKINIHADILSQDGKYSEYVT